jgi:hypothetical protein
VPGVRSSVTYATLARSEICGQPPDQGIHAAAMTIAAVASHVRSTVGEISLDNLFHFEPAPLRTAPAREGSLAVPTRGTQPVIGPVADSLV